MTPQLVERMREMKREGQSLRAIGEEFGVSSTTVMRLTRDIPSTASVGRPRVLPNVHCLDCGRDLDRRRHSIRCADCYNARRARVRDDEARCSRCEQWKPLDEFSKSKHSAGIRAWCKACESAANVARFKGDPLKSYARLAVFRAVRDGVIERGPCEECGATGDVEGHHDDYTKPLEVRWLCPTHHQRVHRAA